MFTLFVVFSFAFGLVVGGPTHSPDQTRDQITVTMGKGGGGGGGRCPKIYAPVLCDDGRTYPNQCEADRRNAQNCVPTGGL